MLPDGKDEPILDVAAGTGVTGKDVSIAVSRGYDTCFSVKACDGLCQLLKSTGSG